MPLSYDQLKERYRAQILYYRLTYIATFIQCGLDILPFKFTFLIYKFILNTSKRCLMFATSGFDLNILCFRMLSLFELCQRKQGSFLAYILEISECYIPCIAQHLGFILPIRNTIIKNGQD
jgi:hypothetical protein